MTTRPLFAPDVAPADLRLYVGYRFYTYVPKGAGNMRQLVTIAAVRQDGDDWLVEPAEFPGYHVVKRDPTNLWANVAPTLDPAKRVDLIDSADDRWADQGDGTYRLLYNDAQSRDYIERKYGPVREA